jgi:NADH dehydrogenase
VKRILVLGGGFAGAFCARDLVRRLGRDEAAVTLVARENYLFFTPFCTEIVGGVMEVRHATAPIREMLGEQAHFVLGSATRIDLAARRVETTTGAFEFDHLVVAVGSVTGTFGLPGVAEKAWFLRTLPEAIAFRNRVLDCLEEASLMPAGADRDARLTFGIAGAGPSGIELACDTRDFLDDVLRRQYPDIDPGHAKIVMFEGGEKVLPSMDDSLSRLAEKRMRRKGIDLRLKTRIKAYDGQEVDIGSARVRCDTLAWTAGLAPNPLVEALDLPKEKGRLRLDRHLRVEGREDVWAMGDCAAYLSDGKPLGPEAQVAVQQAPICAKNIAATLRGRPLREFRFRRYGRLVSLGRRYAVTELFGMRFSGFIAWWLWRTIYLMKLPGLRNKVRVMLDWTLDLFFPRETVRIEYAPDRKRKTT